ncbi:MAG: tRNA (N(6)-L-threonylcarbamoyladenosine(37)-C(2))-methylthiotransferase MtaB, partial [Bacteroidales bacterium]|nr:tRNA (N(6)-L-threonylcarbamoyladenosine(37)-C(2))-methylthiotransferase MtaB [Bacteroidales bacterium]
MNQVKKKVAFHTLGCKLNFAETSAISRLLPADRFEKTRISSEADIFVINTCSVTAAADKKCRQLVKKLIKQSPGAFVVVAGCYAQLRPEALASIEGVDLVLGTNEKFSLDEYLENISGREKPEIHVKRLTAEDPFNYAFSVDDRTRSFLKVQDGCDYCCSYCTVPLARGRSRNPSVETLVKEASFIASKGVKEIVLTGVNIGDFGKSTGETFTELLRELLKVEGIERYRISSIEPDLITDELLELASENKRIMHHFHIPLQSACDRTLRMMGRKYLREIFAGRVTKIKNLMPLAGIGADVITGFPGETEQDFEETYNFLKEMPVNYLHVFTFSERPGTKAEKMNEKVK